MKTKILIGSIAATVLLVLASFPSIAGYQTTKSTIAERTSIIKQVRDRITNSNWEPGEILSFLINFIFVFLVLLLDFLIN